MAARLLAHALWATDAEDVEPAADRYGADWGGHGCAGDRSHQGV